MNKSCESSGNSNGVYYNIEQRKIFLSGEFSSDSAKDVVLALHNMEKAEERVEDSKKAPIDLYIQSVGGDTDCFLSIYDTIQSMKCLVNTIGVGRAYSSGAMLLLTGTGVRKAYSNCSIMIHEFTAYNINRFSGMQNYHAYLNRLNNRITAIIAVHTGQPVEKVAEDIRKDVWMFPEEALEYGIIDEIIQPVGEAQEFNDAE
jgi:ATP-dependent Clp protease protease subunit